MKQLLVFILLSGFLCWFMFTPVYRHVLVLRHAALQKEVDYLLEVGASGTYGYINSDMITASKWRLQQIGFDPDDLVYTVTTESGRSATMPQFPVPRGEGIYISITYPYENLFVLDRLVGLSVPDSSERMGAYGMKMSEFVP